MNFSAKKYTLFKIVLGLLFYFNSLSLPLMGQHSNLIFSSNDGFKFKVKLNNITQNQTVTNELSILRVEGNQNYMVQILDENDSLRFKQSIYILDEYASHFFEVKLDKIRLEKIVFNTYKPKKYANNQVVTYISSAEMLKTNLVENKDTLTTDTVYKVPFDDYYKMPDYKGKIGCPWPIKAEIVNEILIQLRQYNLDERKVTAIKEFKELNSNFCITMEQTIEIIGTLQYDESKIDIVKLLYPSIYDQSNLIYLKPKFNYENSYDELKLFFGI